MEESLFFQGTQLMFIEVLYKGFLNSTCRFFFSTLITCSVKELQSLLIAFKTLIIYFLSLVK